jgi:hypothetical protein
VSERRDYWRARYQRHRERVFAILGDRCVRCGFTDRRALQVDHIHGGGSIRAKALGAWGALDEVVSHPDPRSAFQMLCANCNWIKRAERNETRSGVAPEPHGVLPLFADPEAAA